MPWPETKRTSAKLPHLQDNPARLSQEPSEQLFLFVSSGLLTLLTHWNVGDVHGEWCTENVHGKMKTHLHSHRGANDAVALESVFLAIYGAYTTPATPFGNNVIRLPWTEPSCNTGQSRNLRTNLTAPTMEQDQLCARHSLPPPRASAWAGGDQGRLMSLA